MNFRNLVLLYFLVLLIVLPINILGEKEPNYKKIQPGGKINNNRKRKLDGDNYIIVKYGQKAEYRQFQNSVRENISYIINENKLEKI